MPFTYNRTIRFQDTDAAGVVYFANVLAICHEAYEESLAASGINLKSFFSNPPIAIPIVHASVDFRRPMFCGDKIVIQLLPKYLSDNTFETHYKIVIQDAEELLANALTKHVCIDTSSRKRKEMPAEIISWLHRWEDTAAAL
ncbi:MAG: acyl-CoA thioesterase [Aphanothece sp. CMT-3BRIN-NPC111]|nr:acyl-CoA thioesterase [Aphanothece sp. CMT-3BRIN-NPC111]